MTVEQPYLEGLEPVPINQLRKAVTKVLKRYRKLPALIISAENIANGRGISKRTIEEREERLTKVGQAYYLDMMRHQWLKMNDQIEKHGTKLMSDSIHRDRAENLLNVVSGKTEDDENALDELREIMLGINPWHGMENDATLDETRQYVISIVRAKEESRQKVQELRNEKQTIELALDGLKSYAPDLEMLLRLRFIENKSVTEVAEALLISKRKYDQCRDQAIAEFAMLIGMTEV